LLEVPARACSENLPPIAGRLARDTKVAGDSFAEDIKKAGARPLLVSVIEVLEITCVHPDVVADLEQSSLRVRRGRGDRGFACRLAQVPACAVLSAAFAHSKAEQDSKEASQDVYTIDREVSAKPLQLGRELGDRIVGSVGARRYGPCHLDSESITEVFRLARF